MMAELELTPRQEREVREIFGRFKEEAGELKASFKRSRQDLSEAMRQDELDVETLGATLAGGDETFERLRGAFAGLVARVHAVLDEDQRERLAEMLERRGGARAF